MRVLQDHPTACEEGVVVLLPRDLLLAFTHGDLIRRKFLPLLRKLVDGKRGVAASGEEVQHWLARRRLGVDVDDSVCHRGGESGVEHGLDVLGADDASPVLAHRPHQHQAQEGPDRPLHDDALLVVGDGAALWLVLVEPLLPGGLIALDEVQDLSEELHLVCPEGMPRELDQVQPHLVRQPLERICLLGLHVQGRASLEEG
mmetsp:Transcript_71716/g.200132  ORF Transcript_71716/g.200132 Transcript_71716/m.200132 type:complete len:201 (-) Transcript_71716:7-609(-)